jgi:hypothetical protein
MKKMALLVVAMCVFCSAAPAAQVVMEVVGTGHDAVEAPMCAEIELPAVEPRGLTAVVRQDGGATVPGQIVVDGQGQMRLWWVAPKVAANSRTAWTATIAKGPQAGGFEWRDNAGNYLDLLFDGRKVTRYMYAHDKSTADRLHETYKVFHHVYGPDGTLLTKGPDGEDPYVKGLYTHHRGVYIGWNKLKHGAGTDDWWHMNNVFMVHRGFVENSAGPVMGRSAARIDWIDRQARPVVAEERRVTVFRSGEGTILLMDFETHLKAVAGDVMLDGDPEHAGFQYRPHNDVAEGPKDVKAKYLFHKDGINALKDQNLPWVGMSYGLKGSRYSVLHLNHPDNPMPSVYSAYRDYGRFGAFFKREIKAGEVLTLKYRIVVMPGDLPDRSAAQGRFLSFTDGPRVDKVSVKR